MKKFSKILCTVLTTLVITSSSLQAFGATTIKPVISTTKASSLATSAASKISRSDALDLEQKIQPFIEFRKGKVILTTNDAKKIGISQKDLEDFQKGLVWAEKSVTISTNANRTITPANKSIIKSNAITITDTAILIDYTAAEVRSGITKGVLVAAVFTALAIVSGDTVVLIGAVSVGTAALSATLALVVGVVTNIAWIYSDQLAMTIDLPYDTLQSGVGMFFVWDANNSEAYTVGY